VSNFGRLESSLYRTTATGREPLAAPNEGGTHVHFIGLKRVGLGCITSRRRGEIVPPTFYERLAYELGVNVAEARRLHLANQVK
jgi:hypothetical protein